MYLSTPYNKNIELLLTNYELLKKKSCQKNR